MGQQTGLHTDAQTVIPHCVGYHPVTSRGAGGCFFPSPGQHLMGALSGRAKRVNGVPAKSKPRAGRIQLEKSGCLWKKQ